MPRTVTRSRARKTPVKERDQATEPSTQTRRGRRLESSSKTEHAMTETVELTSERSAKAPTASKPQVTPAKTPAASLKAVTKSPSKPRSTPSANVSNVTSRARTQDPPVTPKPPTKSKTPTGPKKPVAPEFAMAPDETINAEASPKRRRDSIDSLEDPLMRRHMKAKRVLRASDASQPHNVPAGAVAGSPEEPKWPGRAGRTVQKEGIDADPRSSHDTNEIMDDIYAEEEECEDGHPYTDSVMVSPRNINSPTPWKQGWTWDDTLQALWDSGLTFDLAESMLKRLTGSNTEMSRSILNNVVSLLRHNGFADYRIEYLLRGLGIDIVFDGPETTPTSSLQRPVARVLFAENHGHGLVSQDPSLKGTKSAVDPNRTGAVTHDAFRPGDTSQDLSASDGKNSSSRTAQLQKSTTDAFASSAPLSPAPHWSLKWQRQRARPVMPGTDLPADRIAAHKHNSLYHGLDQPPGTMLEDILACDYSNLHQYCVAMDDDLHNYKDEFPLGSDERREIDEYRFFYGNMENLEHGAWRELTVRIANAVGMRFKAAHYLAARRTGMGHTDAKKFADSKEFAEPGVVRLKKKEIKAAQEACEAVNKYGYHWPEGLSLPASA